MSCGAPPWHRRGMATDVEARLALLEAERAITRTLHRYAHSIDYGDEEGWVDCFTEDGVFDVRSRHPHQLKRLITGRDELRAFIARHTRAPELWHKHLLVEPAIDVDGDTASCVSYLAVVMEHDDMPGQLLEMTREVFEVVPALGQQDGGPTLLERTDHVVDNQPVPSFVDSELAVQLLDARRLRATQAEAGSRRSALRVAVTAPAVRVRASLARPSPRLRAPSGIELGREHWVKKRLCSLGHVVERDPDRRPGSAAATVGLLHRRVFLPNHRGRPLLRVGPQRHHD